jgi:hypothetical protein
MPLPGNFNSAYDQLSAVLAEEFVPYADDSFFKAAAIIARAWEEAEQRSPGRYLAADIISSDNANAGVFGPYDIIPQDPQAILSTATFPWSWSTCSIQGDYQTLRSVQGSNVRLDWVATQLQTGLASVAKNVNIDMGNTALLGGKGRNLGTGINWLSVIDAADNGVNVNTYGSISRTGTGSFANWQGQSIGNVAATLPNSGIGSASNDPAWKWFAQIHTACALGQEGVTDWFTTKNGVSSYMNVQAANQRVSPGDVAEIGFADAFLFNAPMCGDDYLYNPNNGTNIGCNYYGINMGHTHLFYFGKKGYDYIDWMFTNQAISKVARYVTMGQLASTESRLNGILNNINALINL